MDQTQRNMIIKEFRSGSSRVLIATDLLARGIAINFFADEGRAILQHSNTRDANGRSRFDIKQDIYIISRDHLFI
jgi:hypothetical protein